MKDKELRKIIEDGKVKDEELRKVLVDLRIIKDVKEYEGVNREVMNTYWTSHTGKLFDIMFRDYRRIEGDSIERNESLSAKLDVVKARFEMLLEYLDLHVTKKVEEIERCPEYKNVEVIEKIPVIRFATEQEKQKL